MKRILLLIIAALAFLPMKGQTTTDKRNPLDYLEPGRRYTQSDIEYVFRDVEYEEETEILGSRTISYTDENSRDIYLLMERRLSQRSSGKTNSAVY